jgi:hypothetical protein
LQVTIQLLKLKERIIQFMIIHISVSYIYDHCKNFSTDRNTVLALVLIIFEYLQHELCDLNCFFLYPHCNLVQPHLICLILLANEIWNFDI